MKCIITLYIASVLIQLSLEMTEVQVSYHLVTWWIIYSASDSQFSDGYLMSVVRMEGDEGWKRRTCTAYIFKHMYLTPREKKRGKPAIIMRDGDGISFYCCFFVGGSVLVFFFGWEYWDINAPQVTQDCASTVCMHVLLSRTLVSLLLTALGPTTPFERLTPPLSSLSKLAACPEAVGH